MPKPPSDKQLRYLKRLGYKGEQPTSSAQASAAIDEMLESRSSRRAEDAVLEQRDYERDRAKKNERDRRAGNDETLRHMLRENKAYGGEGLYAGFRFVELEEEKPNQKEAPYAGAFLPIQVAAKYPELLDVETLEIEEVMVDDRLPKGTPMVVGPGRFRPVGSRAGCFGVVLALAVIIAIIAG